MKINDIVLALFALRFKIINKSCNKEISEETWREIDNQILDLFRSLESIYPGLKGCSDGIPKKIDEEE